MIQQIPSSPSLDRRLRDNALKSRRTGGAGGSKVGGLLNLPMQILIVGDPTRAQAELPGVLSAPEFDVIGLPDFATCASSIAGQPPQQTGLVVSNPLHPNLHCMESLSALHVAHPSLSFAIAGFRFESSLVVAAAEMGIMLLRKPILQSDVEGVIRRICSRPPPVKAVVNSGLYIEELKSNSFFLAISPSMHEILSKVMPCSSPRFLSSLTATSLIGAFDHVFQPVRRVLDALLERSSLPDITS
jgi:hypothetical protein